MPTPQEIADAVLSPANINKLRAAIWAEFIGPDKATPDADRGRAGDVLARASARALKSAQRSAAILALLQNGDGDPDVTVILEALKGLPAEFVNELKRRL